MNSKPPSYTKSSDLNPRNKEIRLYRSTSQRKTFETLKDLYSIIKTTEHLEIANVRETINNENYTTGRNNFLLIYLFIYVYVYI